MRTGSIAALICAGLAALAIAGCGDDGESSSTPTAESESSESAAAGKVGDAKTTLDVSETDYELDPADPTVKSGTVTINATNDGKVTHSLEVESEEAGIEEELPNDLAPGDSGKLTAELPPGTYEWYCPIADHAELGMEGELTVK